MSGYSGGGGTPTATKLLDNVASNGSFPNTKPTNWTASRTTTGTFVEIIASAGMFSGAAAQTVTLNLRIDTVVVKSATLYYAAAGAHATVPTIDYAAALTPGAHVFDLTITSAGDSSADSGDFASMTLKEWA